MCQLSQATAALLQSGANTSSHRGWLQPSSHTPPFILCSLKPVFQHLLVLPTQIPRSFEFITQVNTNVRLMVSCKNVCVLCTFFTPFSFVCNVLSHIISLLFHLHILRTKWRIMVKMDITLIKCLYVLSLIILAANGKSGVQYS